MKQNAPARELAHRLPSRASESEDAWQRRVTRAGASLVLEPLHIDHAGAFLTQYRDPQIAAMIQLPQLDSIGEVRRWIERALQVGARHRYAVTHEAFGFVGYVSLRVSASEAHFSFWTGVDYQGRGFGIEAGKLLCRFAEEQGVESIYASAFEDNVRSIRALERIGFVRMRLTMADEADRRTFLCRSAFDIASREAAYIDCMRKEEIDIRLIDADGRQGQWDRAGGVPGHR